MNNYFKNQIKRAGCSMPQRIVYRIESVLFPRRYERMWKNHATEMQNQLNDNNWKRYKFYVDSRHDVSRDWLRVINYGYFVYDPQA